MLSARPSRRSSNSDAVNGELTDTRERCRQLPSGRSAVDRAASSAEETSVNVQTVSDAAGQLGESVQAIEGHSTKPPASFDAPPAWLARPTKQRECLESAAQRIDEVVGSSVTLPAKPTAGSHATIEARGPARPDVVSVVASEVKALATQTAKPPRKFLANCRGAVCSKGGPWTMSQLSRP